MPITNIRTLNSPQFLHTSKQAFSPQGVLTERTLKVSYLQSCANMIGHRPVTEIHIFEKKNIHM